MKIFLSPNSNSNYNKQLFKNDEITVEKSLEQGIEALTNYDTPVSQWLCYNAYSILTSLKLKPDNSSTMDSIKQAIISKKALNHWLAY